MSLYLCKSTNGRIPCDGHTTGTALVHLLRFGVMQFINPRDRTAIRKRLDSHFNNNPFTRRTLHKALAATLCRPFPFEDICMHSSFGEYFTVCVAWPIRDIQSMNLSILVGNLMKGSNYEFREGMLTWIWSLCRDESFKRNMFSRLLPPEENEITVHGNI